VEVQRPVFSEHTLGSCFLLTGPITSFFPFFSGPNPEGLLGVNVDYLSLETRPCREFPCLWRGQSISERFGSHHMHRSGGRKKCSLSLETVVMTEQNWRGLSLCALCCGS
jgi:hypothetical protein